MSCFVSRRARGENLEDLALAGGQGCAASGGTRLDPAERAPRVVADAGLPFVRLGPWCWFWRHPACLHIRFECCHHGSPLSDVVSRHVVAEGGYDAPT